MFSRAVKAKGGRRANQENRYYRSAWEANWGLYLNFLVSQKQIKTWEYEPDTFEFKTIKKGTRFYTPDFKIINLDDSFYYEEVKGWMDATSKTKLKRMGKYYPEIKVVLIEKKLYTEVKNKLGKMLKFE